MTLIRVLRETCFMDQIESTSSQIKWSQQQTCDELLGSGLFRRSSCSSKDLRVFLFFEFEDFDAEFLGALRLESKKKKKKKNTLM